MRMLRTRFVRKRRRMHESLQAGVPGLPLVLRTFGGITALVTFVNVAGGIVVGALLYALNASTRVSSDTRLLVLTIGAVYGVAAILGGALFAFILQGRTLRWVARNRIPTIPEAQRALRNPLDLAVVTGVLWVFGALVMAIVAGASGAPGSAIFGLSGGLVLAGLTTAGVTYMITLRVGKPVTIIALSVCGPNEALQLFNIRVRMVLNWLLASGIPLFGIILILSAPRGSTHIVGAGIFAAVIALITGATASSLLARAIGDPMRTLAAALRRIGQGDLDTEVSVDDIGEIGQLQQGLNDMVAGLRERERIQDLFGRHVGPAVAEEAILGGVTLSGEAREVVALFVDITASTSMTRRTDPIEFVGMLNRFFGIVVEAVEEHGGLVNKFEGDAALCIFGAPVELANPAAAALAAARTIRDLVAEGGEVEVGIGVAAGPVIAGQIGHATRLEYTVIGDAVNEAARLTDLAKRVDGHILASEVTVDAATDEEREHWTRGRVFRLRGRDAPTHTYRSPVAAPVAVES
jgi:adenylate cyclase